MNKKLVILLSFLVIASLLLVGCQKSNETNNGETEALNEDPGPKDSVSLVAMSEITSLDPYSTASATDFAMIPNIFDTLVEGKDTGELVANLANSWDISDDGLTYTFHLKEGVKFHNGQELKASDIVFTCNIAKESPYSASIGQVIDKAVELDEYTVEINLVSPYAPFLQSLTSLYILNEKALTEAGENHGKHPIGTGPYKYVNYELGQKVVFESFDEYHRGTPAIKKLVYKIIPDANTGLIALESGDVDYMSDIPSISYESTSNNKDLQTFEIQTQILTYVLVNMGKEPFSNLQVRQALNHAIDKDIVLQMAVEGLGETAEYVLNNGTFGYSEKVTGYEFNLEKAKDLLVKAGYPNGFETTIKTIETLKKDAEIIQEQLGQVGIKASIELIDASAFIEELAMGNYGMSLLAMSLEPDADFWGWCFENDGSMNFSFYSNPRVDDLFNLARLSTDDNERLEMYEELFQTISDDGVIVPLYHNYLVSASNAKLRVPEFDPFGHPRIYQMSWE